MTDKPKTPENLTPHITESLDPCRCPGCATFGCELRPGVEATLFEGAPCYNERWHCPACGCEVLYIREGHATVMLWLDVDNKPQVLILTETVKQQAAEEVYERFKVLLAAAQRVRDAHDAGLVFTTEDWAFLECILKGSRGLIRRVEKKMLG